MVLTEVETSMMGIRLVGRRMDAEVALKVPAYLNSCRRNRWLSIDADPQPKVSSIAGWRGY
jgi:hypothetical protein